MKNSILFKTGLILSVSLLLCGCSLKKPVEELPSDDVETQSEPVSDITDSSDNTATDIAKKIIKSEKIYIDSVLDEGIEFDSNGKVIKSIWYSSDGSIAYWNEYQYDSNGNEIKFISYNSDGSISDWEEHQYDSNGNKIKYIRYDSDGYISNGPVFDWKEYQYDSNGNVIKSISYNRDGSISDWGEYQYDSNGNQIKFISYNRDGLVLCQDLAQNKMRSSAS